MKSHINDAGNRIVDATPNEINALRPCILAALRRHGCPEREIEDRAQDVELFVWQAVNEGRVWCDRLSSAKSALISFTFQATWYVWKNYSRLSSTWREIPTEDLPELATSCTVARLEARDALRHLLAEPRVSHILLLSLDGPRPERCVDMPRATFWAQVAKARKWAKEVDAGKYRDPAPPTPKHRKKKR